MTREGQISPGASPLTRGKLGAALDPDCARGRIPAHAGKTSCWVRRRLSRWAHPRSRGENIKAAAAVVAEWGASPLTRGKHRAKELINARAGRIPAHAGKTPPPSAGSTAPWAHPRSRGENGGARARGDRRPGASPLTRGKRVVEDGHALGGGRIPAHAGKTGWCGPRWSGSCGASPLTRGKLHAEDDGVSCWGRIPAHAGKTR